MTEIEWLKDLLAKCPKHSRIRISKEEHRRITLLCTICGVPKDTPLFGPAYRHWWLDKPKLRAALALRHVNLNPEEEEPTP